MKKTLYTILISGIILGASFSATPSKAFADCQTLYGGGQTCTPEATFTVNKLVQKPGKGGGEYVDNLSMNDPKYSPSQKVNYEIIVTNTGSQTIPTIKVVDTFPGEVTFVSGVGSYDSNSKTLTFNVDNLGAGKSNTYYVTVNTLASDALPNDQGIICNVINNVVGTDNKGKTSSDSSSLCIQKSTLGVIYTAPAVKQTPPTGPEMLPLLSLIPGGLAGLMFRKRSNKFNKGGEK